MAQQIGVETTLHVEALNTLVTLVATALILFLTPGLQKALSRRHRNSLSRGETPDLLVSEGLDGVLEFFWKVRRTSSQSSSAAGGRERRRVIRDLAPYVLVITGLNLLPFSTSGVGATASQRDGSPVKVIGSLANPSGEVVETLDLPTLWALQRGDVGGEAAPFLLGSPELLNHGTDVTGLDWSVLFSGTDFENATETASNTTDLRIFGHNYTVERDGAGEGTYPVTTCLKVAEAGGVYSVGTCADVRVELEANEFVVESIQMAGWTSRSCQALTDEVFNQGITYRRRTLTLNETFTLEVYNDTFTFAEDALVGGAEVTALCGEIYESVIEACLFEVGGHLYLGDWNIGEFEGSCEPHDGSNDEYASFSWVMAVLEMDAGSGMLPSREEHHVAVAMLAEIVAGSGTIGSRQQLALVLGAFSRMAGMKLGVGTAYYPETVVVVTMSRVVLLLWAVLAAAGCVMHARERRLGRLDVFIPVTAWDWFAVGARESLGDGGASLSTPPAAHHYLTKYGCHETLARGDDGIQRLSWIRPGLQEEAGRGSIRGHRRTIHPRPPPSRRPKLERAGEDAEPSKRAPGSNTTSVCPPQF